MFRIRSVTTLLLLLAATPAAAAEPDPGLWPEAQRAFYEDGPGLLLSEAQREELGALDEAGRTAFIEAFLATDPIPETAANELAEGIRRRVALARRLYFTPADVRYRLVFLNGEPTQRLEVDCGQVFEPLEVWGWGAGTSQARRSIRIQEELEPAVESRLIEGRKWPRRFSTWEEGPKLVVYQPRGATTFRLWQPFDTKRALYNDDMEYLLEQYEELRNQIRGRRFDLQLCPDTEVVEEATGILGLRDFLKGRPTGAAVRSFLAPPDDLAVWAREAAATPVAEGPAPLLTLPLAVSFPRRDGQLMVVRLLLPLPTGAELPTDEEGNVELVVEGVLENGSEVFGEARLRYRTPPPPAGQPMALAVDQALRPGQTFVARLRVEDEISGREAWVAGGFEVPRLPDRPPASDSPAEAAVAGQPIRVEESTPTGVDNLVLAPPLEGQVSLGLWRAQALITGRRITKVVFLVDGERQLTRSSPPFTAEVRLATHPTEQVVRAEGYDDEGELVAADEVILNQPRGSFRVRLLEPQRGAELSGEVPVRAEVVLPDEATVERVEFRVNDELVDTRERPPWTTRIQVPPGPGPHYVAATAFLTDGRRTEDVVFLNAPEYLEELEVRLVELYTTVTDRSGRLVRGLEAADFEVLEEGRPQEITKFELVENLPLTVGITIDTSGSMASSLVEAQRTGRAFLESMVSRRQDRCLVVGFSGKATLIMPPTDDVESCAQGLEGLRAVGWTALHDAVVSSLYYMRELQGQRALVLLSDGDDTASGIHFDDTLEYARRSGVVIFPVGLDVPALSLDVRRKLGRLAEETGGRTFYIDHAEELEGVYSQIEGELRSRYLLAYAADSGAGGNPEYREVEVRTKRRGLKARTIRGYYP